jgi:segregation and condensation protein B
VVGKMDKPGNPLLYGTTKDFLSYFGLKSLDELPKLPYDEDLRSLEKDHEGEDEDEIE